MRHWITGLAAAFVLMAGASAPAATTDAKRAVSPGFQGIFGVGLNACVAAGENCRGQSADLGLLISAGWRFSSLVSVGLDFGYGIVSGSESGDVEEDRTTALAVMPTMRFHGIVRNAELHVGIGLGYARQSNAVAVRTRFGTFESGSAWSTAFACKLVAGFAVEMTRNLKIGATVEYYSHPATGELCAEGDCFDPGDLSLELNDRATALVTLTIVP